MNVLHVVTTLGTGGVERVLLEIARAFREPGERLEVAYLQGPDDVRGELERLGVPVTYLHAPRLAALPGAARRLRARLSRGELDLVHSHLLQGDFVAARATAGRFPHVRAQHNQEHALERRAIRWLYRKTLAGRGPLVVPTRAVAGWLIERCGEPRSGVHVVPYGIAAARAEDEVRWSRERSGRRAQWGLRDGERAALVLARIAPQKGQLALLRALRSVPPAGPWIWIFAGAASAPRELARLTAELRAHPWRDRVRLAGPSSEPALCVRSADALCIPSRWEGFGLVALEAMAAGTPVVAHDLPALREVLGEHARFVAFDAAANAAAPIDAAAFVAALRALEANATATQRHVYAARERAAREFSLQRMLEDLRSVYTEMLRTR